MSTLRERIEARRIDLLAEREIAEAAVDQDGDWTYYVDDVYDGYRRWDELVITDCGARLSEEARDEVVHIVLQNPANTIARIDRELAGIDADLALYDAYSIPGGGLVAAPGSAMQIIAAASAALNARYPEGGSQ